MKKIKGKHVLIVTSGSSLKKHWDKIKLFIDNNDVITIGCNVVNDFIYPDYHLWGSRKRWKKYGNRVSKKSVMVFPVGTEKSLIREHWKGSYKTCDISERLPGSDVKNHKTIYHYFKSVGMVSILWAYTKKASKISVVGMDGYTFYPKSDLKSKSSSQHCYGSGFTDGQDYAWCREKDRRNKKINNNIFDYGKKKYGFYFKIITPTVHEDYYDPSVLGIEEKYTGGKISKRDRTLKIRRKGKFKYPQG